MGFTHYWTKSKKGRRIVGRKTDKKRLRRVDTSDNPMVPGEPAQAGGRTTRETDGEITGTLIRHQAA
jgi:hypothetical protein